MESLDRFEYRVAWSEEDQAYIGRVTESPLLAAHGETHEKALAEIRSVVRHVIEDMKETGDPIPSPISEREFSGRFQLRVPESLHQQIAREAEREGVSMNQLVLSRLERSIR